MLKACVLSAVALVGMESSIALAQERQTAEQMFQQGLAEFSAGNFPAAKQTLLRVDPMQLPKDKRVTLYETIKDIDRRTQNVTDPAAQLKEASDAQAAGQLPKAIALYRQVAASSSASGGSRRSATSDSSIATAPSPPTAASARCTSASV